ncbi:DUF305 domain-containing protein [Arthrobacter sp. UYEF3]|uniref:DUF305 domain-containing protein n=1 Tax=Arthrobacter sp. UYEF3 TaxID=1756365 RepID=UPI003396B7AF
MNTKFLAVSATALASVIALAGCASGAGSSSSTTPGTGSSSSGMPGMDHGAMPGMGSGTATAASDHNPADTMFTQGMIPHHTQAVEMSDMMLTKKDIPASVTALATKIKAAQGPEIATMTGWLKSWNESATMSAGHGMDGMMGDDDLKKLNAAQGTEAARLFLQQMIAHHEGAVMMAKTEMTQGKNADAVRLSKDIAAAQEAEIQEMRKLLAAL